jgi:hypothetical protein
VTLIFSRRRSYRASTSSIKGVLRDDCKRDRLAHSRPTPYEAGPNSRNAAIPLGCLRCPWPWDRPLPKLFKIRALRPFHFAIEAWRSRRHWTELDRLFHRPELNRFGKELEPGIGLYALDRKQHFLHDAVKEGQSALCISSWINAEYLVAATIIDRRVLRNPGRNFVDVHLHAVAWDGTRILPGALTMEARLIKMLCATNENVMNGVE